LAGLALDPAPFQDEMNDEGRGEGDTQIKVDVPPIVPMKVQKVLRVFGVNGSLGNDEPQQKADENDPEDTNKEDRINDVS
jgi:hypothetical protein